ncbi:hypothetical protein [Shewanella baltica]|uniref:hypothetical protein n=1 Tax=Shewanella baltica TaxID=62322 RepID=UPI00217DDD13|nr:hypothetical protein [Shewanella baltica]MCS6162400.1 hypothetical protein [Shewanella baltica]
MEIKHNQKLAVKKSIIPFLFTILISGFFIVSLVNVYVTVEQRAAVLGAITAQTLSFLPVRDCEEVKGESIKIFEDCKIKEAASKKIVESDDFRKLKAQVIAFNSYTLLHLNDKPTFEKAYDLTTELIAKLHKQEPNASLFGIDYLSVLKSIKEQSTIKIAIVKLQAGIIGFFVASLILFGSIYRRALRKIEGSK